MKVRAREILGSYVANMRIIQMHNHTNSRSILVRSGYDGDPNKASYDPKGQKTAEQETALGHGTINHNEDLKNGTLYLMINATGFKNTGKESIQNPYPW